MDFGELLSVAQKNSAKKESSSYYPSKFTPPKKETKQSKSLSENIKKFLAKKEAEERQKAAEEKRKRENLLALRDHKAQSRINKHLKVCKAANKSVIADAVNNENTAVTMAGPSQPDEDDYGYVSQEASAFYNQLMNKYNNLPPEKPLFAESGKRVVKDIASTKDRVRQALKQQELEESLPHRRKRKSTDVTTDSKEIIEKEKITHNDEKSKPAKKRPSVPPPMDFMSLLKLAEKKQFEPIVVEAKPKPKTEDIERPMTKKQKKEYEKERDWKDKRERERKGEIPKTTNVSSSDSVKSSKSSMISKISKTNNSKPAATLTAEKTSSKTTPSSSKKIPERPIERSSVKSSEKDAILEERRKLEAEKRELENMRRMIEEEKKKLALQNNKIKKPEDNHRSSNSGASKMKSNGKLDKPTLNNSSNGRDKSRPFPPADVKSRQFPPADVKSRQFPPADVKSRQFPPADVRNRVSKPPPKRPINPRRIYDDDEDEYDSELDDFIDDGPQDQTEDYSKYISEIFGYDKSKYRNFDDDDTNMESNFAQQLKEEFVSTKLGIMEDLEDIRQEALEKKRKAMMMKKLKRK